MSRFPLCRSAAMILSALCLLASLLWLSACSGGAAYMREDRNYEHSAPGASSGYSTAPRHVASSEGFASTQDPGRGRIADPHAYPGVPSYNAGAGEFTTYLQPGEDLWIIARPAQHDSRTYSDDYPGCGALVCDTPDRGRVPVPLRHTAVNASIAGYIASVDVTQQYHNPFSHKIEAVYVFPLPENAAVTGFLMTIGDRTIRGIIREREEAQQIYNDARAQGYNAALMTQERPNIFTQRVANIEPGHRIDIAVKYFHTLAYNDGQYEFVFPMVVGPRFNPPYAAPDQQVRTRHLTPNQRSGHDIALSVALDAGVPLQSISCDSHEVAVDRVSDRLARVTLSSRDDIPNKDFVLRYRVDNEQTVPGLMTHVDPSTGQGYFTLMLYPPSAPQQRWRSPMEMVFVIDTSGSMSGKPLEQAKRAIDRALDHLQPQDSFQIIRFSDSASQFGRAPVPASRDAVRDAKRFVDSLQPGGGTMMLTGLSASLDFPHDPERLRVVTFLTDGFIGNERDILAALHHKLGASRIFSFGVGQAPNRFLMDQMARMGRGCVAYLSLDDSAREVMDLFFDRVSRPAMTNITLSFQGINAYDINPPLDTVPTDLFAGRPVIVTGRFDPRSAPGDAHTPRAVLSGDINGVRRAYELPFDAAYADHHPALAAVWARARIQSLADRALWDASAEWNINNDIRATALSYGLISAHTSFIAVDSSYRTPGDHGYTVTQPVPVPDGTRYDTTVGR